MIGLSIICPVYNVEDYITECIDSVLPQLRSNVELILINDGSTDTSGDLISSYSSYSNIKVFHKENGGLSDARNFGLKHSSYDYVAFLDSDDILDKEALDAIFKLMYCDIELISFDVFRFEKNSNSRRVINCEVVTKEGYASKPFYACNKVFKKSLFEKVTFPIGEKFEDISTIPLVISQIQTFAHISSSLYGYRVRPGAITTTTENVEIEILNALILLKKRAEELNYYNDFVKKSVIKESFGLLLNLSRSSGVNVVLKNRREIFRKLNHEFDFSTFNFKTVNFKSRVCWSLLSNNYGKYFILSLYCLFRIIKYLNKAIK
ncbi:glycosyltransferase family 2 protein [Vibrio alginolyticus]